MYTLISNVSDVAAGRNRVEPTLGRAASAGQGSASATERDFWI